MSKDIPAFPSRGRYKDDPENHMIGAEFIEEGMTLRDYYAGQALVGVLASGNHHTSAEENGSKIAEIAYTYADAMMEARDE